VQDAAKHHDLRSSLAGGALVRPPLIGTSGLRTSSRGWQPL